MCVKPLLFLFCLVDDAPKVKKVKKSKDVEALELTYDYFVCGVLIIVLFHSLYNNNTGIVIGSEKVSTLRMNEVLTYFKLTCITPALTSIGYHS